MNVLVYLFKNNMHPTISNNVKLSWPWDRCELHNSRGWIFYPVANIILVKYRLTWKVTPSIYIFNAEKYTYSLILAEWLWKRNSGCVSVRPGVIHFKRADIDMSVYYTCTNCFLISCKPNLCLDICLFFKTNYPHFFAAFYFLLTTPILIFWNPV